MQGTILFVHGFGVKKDARGIFTDIAQALTENPAFHDTHSVLFDLNQVTEGSNNIILNPLSVQVTKLRAEYEKAKTTSGAITIIAHSQGCVVTALADLPNIEKVILLAPPTNNDLEKIMNTFRNRPGTIFNTDGDSILTRRDGSTTTIPKEYWSDRQDLKYLDLYMRLAEHNDVTTILARQDEVVSNDAAAELAKISKVITIDGDHNFTNTYRLGLIEELLQNL